MTVYKGQYSGYDPCDKLRAEIETIKLNPLYIVWMEDYDATPENIERIFYSKTDALNWISKNIQIFSYKGYGNAKWYTRVICDYYIVEYNFTDDSKKVIVRYDPIEFEGKYE